MKAGQFSEKNRLLSNSRKCRFKSWGESARQTGKIGILKTLFLEHTEWPLLWFFMTLYFFYKIYFQKDKAP